MSDLSNRSFLYFMTSLLKSFGLLLLTFFLTPLLLNYIGSTNFGTFKVLMEVYGYLSLLEFGLYSSLIACLIPLIRNGKELELSSLLNQGRYQYLKAALWTLGISFCVFPLLPSLTSWKGNTNDLFLTFALVSSTSLLIPFQPYKIYLEASNQGHRVNVIIFLQNLLFIVLGIFFAYQGWGLISQGIAVLASNIFGVALIRWYSGISIKWKPDGIRNFLPDIRKYQKSQVLNDLATKICLNCDQLIIAIILGPVMVTKVFLGQRVVLIMQSQLQALGQSTYASLGSLYYSDNEVFKKRVMEVTKILSIMSVATLVPICILNQSFIALWVGESYQMQGNALTYIASSNAFLYSLFSFWSFIFTVLGKPAEITTMIWNQALVNLLVSIIATHYLGGIGPILGTLVSFVVVPLWRYPRLLKTHFSLSEVLIFKAMMVPAAWGILPLVLYHISPWKFEPTSWPSFIFTGVSIFSTYSLLLIFLLFNPEERMLFFNRLKAICKKIFRR